MPRGRQTARLSYLLLLASSALLAAAPTNAAPQAAPQSSASPDAAAILPTDLTEQVVVSANLTATPADQVGSSVTVVDAATIAAAGKTSTFELLRAVPGVDVVQSGGAGRTATVFLRGANSAHTLVLVDGVRINSPASGEVDFADLRAEQIERIEILRGPQSSLYGSEAIGGVINIVTRRGAPGARGDVSLEGGNAGSWRAAAGADGGEGRFDYRVSAAHERQPGYSLAAAAAGDEKKFPYESDSAAALFGWKLDDGRIEATFRHVRATSHPDGYDFVAGPIPAPNYEQTRTRTIGSLGATFAPTAWWSQTVRAGISDEKLVGEDPDNVYNDYDIKGRNVSVLAQSDFKLAKNDTLSAGLAWERRSGDSAGNFDETARIASVFVQDQWSWNGRVFLTGALRRDDHSVFGGKTTGRATAAYKFADGKTRLRASYGTGFKAPTFNDLYYPYFGNPDLKPETSRGWDAGIGRSFADGAFDAEVGYFDNRIDDLIQWDDRTYRAENIGRAKAHGVEATFGARLGGGTRLRLDYTYDSAENADTGARLPRRPKQTAGLSAIYAPDGPWDGSLSLVAVRDRVDSAGLALDDYVRVDASFGYRAFKQVRFFARAQNLFDRSYEELPGYRTPGRLVSVGAALTF